MSNTQGIREAYDYRIAVPLAILAVICLVFVAMNGHKHTSLNSSSVVSRQTVQTSSMAVKRLSALPTLSKQTPTVNVSPGTTPTTINTADPQTTNTTSTGDASSATSSSTNPQSSSASTPEDNADSTNEVNNVNNLINGIGGGTTKVVNSNTNQTVNLLSSL